MTILAKVIAQLASYMKLSVNVTLPGFLFAVAIVLFQVVRRDKAPFLSGCESRPATVAPAGNSRSG